MSVTWWQVQEAIATLSGGAEKVRARRDLLAQKLTALAKDSTLAEEYRASSAKKLRDRALADLQALRDEMATARERVQEFTPDPGSETAQLLAETRMAKAWTRAERALTAGTAPGELIRQATQERDVPALQALRAELPAFLAASQSQGQSPATLAGAVEDVTRMADLGLVQAMDSGPVREALKARLHAAVTFPMVEVELNGLQADAFGKDLTGVGRVSYALERQFAEQDAGRVLAVLDGGNAA